MATKGATSDDAKAAPTPSELDRHHFAQICLTLCQHHAQQPPAENLCDGTGSGEFRELACRARTLTEIRNESGASQTWAEILAAATVETLAAKNDDELLLRLQKTATECVKWAVQVRRRREREKNS